MSNHEEEQRLWREWKESGEHPSKTDALLALPRLKKSLQTELAMYQGRVPIPLEALQGEATRQAIAALRKYDPKWNTQLHTHLGNNVRLRRYVTKNQNFTRMAEEPTQLIGEYQRAKEQLRDQLGREATNQEIADQMNTSHRRVRAVNARMVERIQQGDKKDLLSSHFERDPFENADQRVKEVMELVYPYELTTDEQLVYEHLLGLKSHTRESSTTVIAGRLGWSPSKVSQVKNRITEKIRKHL